MGMNQLNRVRAMQLANGGHKSREKKGACGRKAQTPGQRKIAKPLRRLSAWPRLVSAPIERLHGKNSVGDPELRKGRKRLSDETS